MDRDTLKNLLLAEKEELSKRVDAIHKDLSSRHISKQFDEQVTQQGNDDVLAGLDQEARDQLVQIEEALKRIDTDEYDICTVCGNTISDERLQAIPHAQQCRNCAA